VIEVGDLVCYKIHFITAQHFPTRLGLAVAIINANAKMPLSSPLYQREVKVEWVDGHTTWEGEGFLQRAY
jgi:hypothetical protein